MSEINLLRGDTLLMTAISVISLMIIGYFPHRVRETFIVLVTTAMFLLGLSEGSSLERWYYYNSKEVSQNGTTIRSGSIQNKARFFTLFPLQTAKMGKTYVDYKKEEIKRAEEKIEYNNSYGNSGGRSYSGGGLSGGK
jgi:hypothetical protein